MEEFEQYPERLLTLEAKRGKLDRAQDVFKRIGHEIVERGIPRADIQQRAEPPTTPETSPPLGKMVLLMLTGFCLPLFILLLAKTRRRRAASSVTDNAATAETLPRSTGSSNRRSWYRLHWVTWGFAVTFGIASLYVQLLHAGKIPDFFGDGTFSRWRGWPLPYEINSVNLRNWPARVMADTVIWAAMAVATIALFERCFRTRFQMSLATVFAIVTTGAIFFSLDWRNFVPFRHEPWYLNIPVVVGAAATVYIAVRLLVRFAIAVCCLICEELYLGRGRRS
jgi:hypothetical protein